MTFFNSLKNIVGPSSDYYSSASHYYSESAKDAKQAASDVGGVLSNVFSYRTMGALAASFLGYEHIAGKIISANTATHLANIFTGNEFSTLEICTKSAATALVADPVICMAGLMATSALISNPKGILDVVTGTVKAGYHTVAATGKALCATGNAGLGLLAGTFEAGANIESKISDFLDPKCGDSFLTSFTNPLFDLTGDLCDSFGSTAL